MLEKTKRGFIIPYADRDSTWTKRELCSGERNCIVKRDRNESSRMSRGLAHRLRIPRIQAAQNNRGFMFLKSPLELGKH